MAEFKEVMKKKSKICKFYDNCRDCPLKTFCPLSTLDCDKLELEDLDRIEETIMNWGKTDWSNVAVDTKILVREYEDCPWRRRHFAEYRDGEVYCWPHGKTSWTSNSSEFVHWEYAKLLEEEEE